MVTKLVKWLLFIGKQAIKSNLAALSLICYAPGSVPVLAGLYTVCLRTPEVHHISCHLCIVRMLMQVAAQTTEILWIS